MGIMRPKQVGKYEQEIFITNNNNKIKMNYYYMYYYYQYSKYLETIVASTN